MGLAAKAFLTGFMKEAATSIKEENERLENYALTRANQLIKEMDEFEEEKKKFESEFDQQARDLTMYIQQANPNLSQKDVHARVSGIIYKGQGKRVISMFEAADNRLTAQMADAFKLEDEQLKSVSDDILNEIKKQMSTGIKKPGGGVGVIPSRGAWGLPVSESVYRGTMEQAANTRGKTLDEFGALRLPRPEEIDTPLQKGRIDLSVLSTGKDTMDIRIDQAARSVADAETDEDKNAAQNELDRLVAIQARTKPKDKDGKISQSDIRSTIKRRLEAIARAHISGDYTTTNDGSINIHSTKGREIFLGKLTSGLEPLLKSYIDAYKDDQGRVPNEVRFAWEAEGARFNDKGQFIGFDPSLFQVTKQPDAGESLKNVPASPPVGDARPSPGDRSGISASKQYTQEQLRAATIRAINANPQEKDKFINEYEAATGLKFNG